MVSTKFSDNTHVRRADSCQSRRSTRDLRDTRAKTNLIESTTPRVNSSMLQQYRGRPVRLLGKIIPGSHVRLPTSTANRVQTAEKFLLEAADHGQVEVYMSGVRISSPIA